MNSVQSNFSFTNFRTVARRSTNNYTKGTFLVQALTPEKVIMTAISSAFKVCYQRTNNPGMSHRLQENF